MSSSATQCLQLGMYAMTTVSLAPALVPDARMTLVRSSMSVCWMADPASPHSQPSCFFSAAAVVAVGSGTSGVVGCTSGAVGDCVSASSAEMIPKKDSRPSLVLELSGSRGFQGENAVESTD
jgi:hypothetical protein